MKYSVYLKIQGEKEKFFLCSRDLYSETPITLLNDQLGYALCRILDLDIESISKELLKYDYKDDLAVEIRNPSDLQIYNNLIRLSEIHKLYPPESFNTLMFDYTANDPTVGYIIERLRSYVNYHAGKKLHYDDGFFRFLYENGFFGMEFNADLINEVSGGYEYFMSCSNDPIKLNDMDAHFAHYSAQLPINNLDSEKVYDITYHNRFALAALITIRELCFRKKIVRKCVNCGKYFVAEKRIDTLYCDNPCPQDSTMSCKKYATHKLWYDRQQDDELAKLSRKILSAKGMLVRRNPDITDYQRSYDYYRRERIKWMEDVETGKATREEYREWLQKMQKQKIIKEMPDGNN